MSKKWFSETEFILGKDAVKTVVTKDLEYYINLVDKALAGSEKTDFNSERCSTGCKMLPNLIVCYKKHYLWESTDAANVIVVLVWETDTATPTFSKNHLDQSAACNTEARQDPLSAEGSDDSTFSSKVFFN